MQNQDTRPEETNAETDSNVTKAPLNIDKISLYRNFTGILQNKPPINWPRFRHVFHVLKDKSGGHQYLEELENQTLVFISPQKIVDSLTTYYDKNAALLYCPNLKIEDFKNSFHYWASTTSSFSSPIEPVRFKSDPGHCWHRLSFDLEQGEFPVWSELLGRMTNRDAFMAWIYSLFVPESDRQQFVWLYGEGRDGKGSITRALDKALGQSYAGSSVPEKTDKHWTSTLLGKRLIAFNDCSNYSFPASGLFKRVTGEDAVPIEQKYKATYSAYLTCKFIFTSNEKPILSNEQSSLRRAIYCTFKGKPRDFGSDYEKFLWDEMPKFLHACMLKYQAACLSGRSIPVDVTEHEELASLPDEIYENLWNKHFKEAPHDPALLIKDKPYVSSKALHQIFAEEGIYSDRAKGKFLIWAENRHGLIRSRVGFGPTREYRYIGGVVRIVKIVT